MPMSISSPARPRWTAVVTTRPRTAPPPAVIRRPAISILQNSGAESFTTSPARPRRGPGCSSLAPAAARRRPSCWRARTRAINWSGFSGSAKYSAGPPSWNQVCIASGSACRTIFSKPLQKAMTQSFRCRPPQGHQYVAGEQTVSSSRGDFLAPVDVEGRGAPAADLPGQVGRRRPPQDGEALPGRGRSPPPPPCRHFAGSRPVRPVGPPSATPGGVETRTTAGGRETSAARPPARRPPRWDDGRSRPPAPRRRRCPALPAAAASRQSRSARR